MLAEYDENGSLKTYYTRGAELISQERNGTKSYYLYDGFDSVRILTDEDGTATDFYTFDAFGNLTEQVGDTENSYLYRGEQYDSFTGLYYLRARYMNPATGTFITMDEYAGSVFEPVSLHKYLYANANPVNNSDPSGYFTLADCSTANAIADTLNKMYTSNMLGTLNGMLNAFLVKLSGGTQEEIQKAFTRGFFDGFLMGGGYAALAKLAGCSAFFKLVVASIDIFYAAGDLQAGIDAFEDGHYILGTLYVVSSISGFFSAIKTSRQTCFTGDTLVAVEDGQKRIDEIEVGDKVWAYNVETGETELKAVTKVYIHSVDEILHLYTDEGDIDTTANHPFYVIGKGWVAAGDLVEGDEIYNLDGSTSIITGYEVEKLDEPVLVYNLEVEDFHSYFVGCVPVLVHNYRTERDLYSWESPYDKDGKPGGGRARDFKSANATTKNDMVGPYTRDYAEGASSFAKVEDGIKKGLHGNYYILPIGTELPDDIGVVFDGIKDSHHTFYPKSEMIIKEFNSKFKNLGWIYCGKT